MIIKKKDKTPEINELDEDSGSELELNEDSESELELEDSDLESEIFNMSGESDFDIFEDEEILKKEVQIVPEEERLYEDKVYERVLYDMLIQDYDLEKRADKRTINEVNTKVQQILVTKNKAINSIELLKENIKYPIINDYLNNNYSQKWIIPVVADTKIIFAKIGKDEFANINDESALTDTQLKDGFIKLNQVNQLKEWKELYNKYSKDIITNKEYLNSLMELLAPYIPDKENKFGITKNLIHSTSVLRYNNINDIFWCDRRALGEVTIDHEIVDPETNEIVSVETKEYIKGEKIEIIGFFVLPFGHNSPYDAIGLNNGQKVVSDRFGLLGKIEKITKSYPAEITFINHGLVDGQRIFISGSNCFPSVDGVHQLKVKVINDNVFSVDIDTSNGNAGDEGMLFSNLKLDYETYKVTQEGNEKLNLKKNKRY
jgi:hypothetical protein